MDTGIFWQVPLYELPGQKNEGRIYLFYGSAEGANSRFLEDPGGNANR